MRIKTRLRLASLTLALFALAGCNLPLPACSTAYLIQAINDANATPAADVINLATGCVYELDQVDNSPPLKGSSGLPNITSIIYINGNGATIRRSAEADKFRLFHIENPGKLTLSYVTLSNGYAFNPADESNYISNGGGAIYNWGEVLINQSIIEGNSAREGGGIFNGGTLEIEASTIRDNHDTAGLPGGAGIHNIGTAKISDSAIYANGLQEGMDAIFNIGNMEIINSTISNNGSGIDNEGQLTLQYVTLAFNAAESLHSSSGQVNVENTLFGPNPSLGACGGMAIQTQGANLDTDGTCGVLFTVPPEGLLLGPLGDNGGATLTHALLAGSPAIDAAAGDCPATDQRGEARPSGYLCDLGAYEAEFSPSLPVVVTNAPTAEETPDEPADTATPTRDPSAAAEGCSATAQVNLFCRPGPGYEPIDEFVPGQSAEVIGFSPDGFYVFVTGPNLGKTCTVPMDTDWVEVSGGGCESLPKLTLPPTPTSTPLPPPPPQCSDEIDNDDDGLIDLADRQCRNADDNDEAVP